MYIKVLWFIYSNWYWQYFIIKYNVKIQWLAAAGIAAGVTALGVGIYTGVTTGDWKEGVKTGATAGLAVGAGLTTLGFLATGSLTASAAALGEGLLASTKVISASGTATGMIFAATGMTSTATYKASEKFIQGKDISFVDATTDIANVGYAGYIIGNVVSIGATILNEYTEIIDKCINYFDNLDKTQNSNLSTSMNYANSNSTIQGCEKAEVDYSNFNRSFNVNNQSKGSTGRIEPHNIIEQLSMEQVKSNPLEGAVKLDKIRMTDSRWLVEDGWVKMQNIVKHSDGSSTNIHFVYNEITGVFDDFKFKWWFRFGKLNLWIIF